jgi:hypothetical protein
LFGAHMCLSMSVPCHVWCPDWAISDIQPVQAGWVSARVIYSFLCLKQQQLLLHQQNNPMQQGSGFSMVPTPTPTHFSPCAPSSMMLMRLMRSQSSTYAPPARWPSHTTVLGGGGGGGGGSEQSGDSGGRLSEPGMQDGGREGKGLNRMRPCTASHSPACTGVYPVRMETPVTDALGTQPPVGASRKACPAPQGSGSPPAVFNRL